jgi:hypothetical protein
VKDVLVYIAGPLTKGGLLANIRRFDDAFFALMRARVPAICPAWSVFALSAVPHDAGRSVVAVANLTPADTTPEQWYAVCLAQVRRCSAVLRLSGESVGADLEVAEAYLCGLPVFATVAEVIAWAENRKDN